MEAGEVPACSNSLSKPRSKSKRGTSVAALPLSSYAPMAACNSPRDSGRQSRSRAPFHALCVVIIYKRYILRARVEARDAEANKRVFASDEAVRG